jgi:hypothetical protein
MSQDLLALVSLMAADCGRMGRNAAAKAKPE